MKTIWVKWKLKWKTLGKKVAVLVVVAAAISMAIAWVVIGSMFGDHDKMFGDMMAKAHDQMDKFKAED